MGFTKPCFIRKNNSELRNKLKELGYHCNPYLGWNNLYTSIFGVRSVYSMRDDIKVTSIALAILIAVVGDTIDMFNNKKKERQ